MCRGVFEQVRLQPGLRMSCRFTLVHVWKKPTLTTSKGEVTMAPVIPPKLGFSSSLVAPGTRHTFPRQSASSPAISEERRARLSRGARGRKGTERG